MAELWELGIVELRDAIASGEATAVEAVEAVFERVETLDPVINSFVELRAEALEEAKMMVPGGPLSGVPVAIKDMFVDRGRTPTVGSKLGGSWMKGRSEVIERLRQAGAIVVGYTNLHEWGVGMTSSVTATGPIRNPWDTSRATGGSSGGSAAAVGAGFVPGAIGTDAGGSIRCPAACCGVVGHKPTWGRVPLAGFVEGDSPLDHAGPITRSVTDARAMLEVLDGRRMWAETPEVSSLRVGVARSHFFDDIAPEVAAGVEEGIEVLRGLVSEVVEVEIPHAEAATYAVGLLLLPLTAAVMADELAAGRLGDLQPEVQKLMALGAEIPTGDHGCGRSHHKLIMASRRRLPTSAFLDFPRLPGPVRRFVGKHFVNQQQGTFGRKMVIDSFDKAFRKVDVIVTPSIPVVPPPLVSDGRVTLPSKSVSSDSAYLPMFGPMNLAGIPTLSLPCARAEDPWVVSMQLAAAKGRDGAVLALGEAFEKATGSIYANRIAPL